MVLAAVTRKRFGSLLVALVLAGAIAVIFVIPSHVTEAPRVSGEIYLELLSDPGPDPFTASVARMPAPASVPAPSGGSSTPSTASPGTGPSTVQRVTGSNPELYGGTRGVSSCDATRLAALLTGSAPRAEAWARIEHVGVADIDAYVKTLTGVVLRQDMRVTDHGYAHRTATDHQAVLQMGTAVLVDSRGAPRVRCASGDPLGEPVALATEAVYLGVRWPGFDASPLVAISPASAAVTQFVLFDAAARSRFARPVGGDGTSDSASP